MVMVSAVTPTPVFTPPAVPPLPALESTALVLHADAVNPIASTATAARPRALNMWSSTVRGPRRLAGRKR